MQNSKNRLTKTALAAELGKLVEIWFCPSALALLAPCGGKKFEYKHFLIDVGDVDWARSVHTQITFNYNVIVSSADLSKLSDSRLYHEGAVQGVNLPLLLDSKSKSGRWSRQL